jgi:hypothetical protein
VKLAGIHASDLVLVDIGGRRFHAYVDVVGEGFLHVTPIERNITYRHIKPRDVICHWRKTGPHRQHVAVTVNGHQLTLG